MKNQVSTDINVEGSLAAQEVHNKTSIKAFCLMHCIAAAAIVGMACITGNYSYHFNVFLFLQINIALTILMTMLSVIILNSLSLAKYTALMSFIAALIEGLFISYVPDSKFFACTLPVIIFIALVAVFILLACRFGCTKIVSTIGGTVCILNFIALIFVLLTLYSGIERQKWALCFLISLSLLIGLSLSFLTKYSQLFLIVNLLSTLFHIFIISQEDFFTCAAILFTTVPIIVTMLRFICKYSRNSKLKVAAISLLVCTSLIFMLILKLSFLNFSLCAIMYLVYSIVMVALGQLISARFCHYVKQKDIRNSPK